MTVFAAAWAGIGVYLAVSPASHGAMNERLGMYLMPPAQADAPADRTARTTLAEMPWLPWAVTGGLIGTMVAQGDLFLVGPGRSVPGLAILGAGAGYFVWSFRRTNAAERKARRLRLELPIVADAIALHVMAGTSISSSMRAVGDQMVGVAVAEIREIVAREDEGDGLAASLLTASRTTAHPDARRLYDLLGHAHESGGRLAGMLAELAIDLRSGIERDLSSEGGKRAVASYGPVLALMIPTALLFLLYPTLIGLRALSGGP